MIESSNEVASKSAAFSSVAGSLGEDAEPFEPSNHIFDEHTFGCKLSVRGFLRLGLRIVLTAFTWDEGAVAHVLQPRMPRIGQWLDVLRKAHHSRKELYPCFKKAAW